MKTKFLQIAVCLFAVIALCGCSKQRDAVCENDMVAAAKYLSLVEGDGYVLATVANPWKEGEVLAKYALVGDVETDVPAEFAKICVPLQRSVVYSSVHTAAIDELGAADGVVGVADGSYFAQDDSFAEEISSGRVGNIGSSMSPSLEKIIDLEPDALLLSPWENGNLGGVERSGLPLIFMADYLENTALGRAEWIKFLGHLYGELEKADSIYEDVSAKYQSLKNLAAEQSEKPRVITEKPYMGVWYVPAGESYMAGMLADAGADYPWKNEPGTASLSLDEAAVLDRGGDARYWLIKDGVDHSDASLLASMPHAEAFAAFPNEVYVCNTSTSSIFRDIAFHPERLLADFIHIFQPEAQPDYELRYYKPHNK